MPDSHNACGYCGEDARHARDNRFAGPRDKPQVASPAVVGNDNAFTVRVGTGKTFACTITFATPWTNTPVCVITLVGDIGVVTAWISDNEARRLMRQGVSGIFLKQAPLSNLVESIHTVTEGGTYLDPSLQRIAEGGAISATSEVAPPVFSERQRKVLRHVLEGLSNKEIAWRLQISESYVKAILQGLFQKTGVRTRGQLVRVAFEQYEDQL